MPAIAALAQTNFTLMVLPNAAWLLQQLDMNTCRPQAETCLLLSRSSAVASAHARWRGVIERPRPRLGCCSSMPSMAIGKRAGVPATPVLRE